MNIIEELEQKIKISKASIVVAQKQLSEHIEGTHKLSIMSVASTELSMEKSLFLLGKYTKKLKKLKKQDFSELEANEKSKAFIVKNNYFKYQIQRIKHDKTKTPIEIQNALSVLCDIPEKMKFEDLDLFTIGHKSAELYLEIHSELDDELIEIKSEFLDLVKNHFNEINSELKLLNYRIPIIILQLRILVKNIKENIDENTLNRKKFTGLPKFEDWWIQELWTSHQAYMGLYKWKKIILSLCITTEQKKAFEIIFKNWILVKKILNVKGSIAYFYNFAFDEMIFKYAELEDEHDEKNLSSMKSIVKKLTENENFITVSDDHNILTPYMKFKIEKKIEKDKDIS
ncbi:MAG: hypothetical protein WA945_08615 [Arcobacteraceae bacterium]